MRNKILKALVVTLTSTVLLASCGSDSKSQLPEMFDRGVNFNISEEQLLKSESELTFKTYDGGVRKDLTSNEKNYDKR